MNMKAQNALQYLVSHIWALLVLVLVLAALYSLGLFGTFNRVPQATPGECQVLRASGPGTMATGLSGVCNGLLPQSVAKFDGATAYVVTAAENYTSSAQQSVGVWVYLNSLPAAGTTAPIIQSMFSFRGEFGWYYLQGPEIYVDPNGNVIYKVATNCAFACSPYGWETVLSNAIIAKKWYFVFAVNGPGSQSGNYLQVCAAKTPQASGLTCNTITATSLPYGTSADNGGYAIGSDLQGDYLNGYISNLQMYQGTLSVSDGNDLYYEGIGGAPIAVQSLWGWYPLNGNPNDYSGNSYTNTIAPTNGLFTYSYNWQTVTNYQAP